MRNRAEGNIHCPECSGKMTQLIDRKKTIVYDYCWSCQGVWLEYGDLRNIKKGRTRTVKKLWRQARKEKARRPGVTVVNYPLLCPSCQSGRLMEQTRYGVTLHECENCKGKFLNSEEFSEINDRNEGTLRKLIEKIKIRFS